MGARSLFLIALSLVACHSAVEVAPIARYEPASIEFREAPEVLDWAFDVKHLPGVDASGAIVIGSPRREGIASTLDLTVHWLEAGKPVRTFVIVSQSEVGDVVYDRDGLPEYVAPLAASVRARVAEVNRTLAGQELRPTVPCKVVESRVTCGSFTKVLDETALGWNIPPVRISDDGPSEMQMHVLEAHWDPRTKQLAVLIEHRCKRMLGDACFMPEKWHIVRLD